MMISDTPQNWDIKKAALAKKCCNEFMEAPQGRRYLFGRNVYSQAVALQVPVAGIIDDFIDLAEWCGTPLVKLSEVPEDALILSCVGGKPLSARRLLREYNLWNLDYFAFYKFSGLKLPEAVFNEGCAELVVSHKAELDWLQGLLADSVSVEILKKIMMFRLTYDLDTLEGLVQNEANQYFEPFVDYTFGKPSFVDVGGFDGHTTKQFIAHAPNYESVEIFEPEIRNLEVCRVELHGLHNVRLHPYGAGARDDVLKFSSNGSASSITDEGDCNIEVRRIDDVVRSAPTFIKMDIEGAELAALEGAREIISRYHPALAICVYHRPSDIWNVPRMVLGMHDGYSVFLRHYTECIYETVMFFVPRKMLR